MEKAAFGAGCFWGIEAAFRKLEGVNATVVGYMGGKLENPSYEDVCTDMTGHAEVVVVEFDPDIISYKELLDLFWNIHNPTQLNRQGPDTGTQYRSVIFYHTAEQENQAGESRVGMEQSGKYQGKIVTEIIPASTFYKAEEYHQHYLEKRGRNHCNI